MQRKPKGERMEITKRLAEFIVNTKFEDLPAKAVQLAKLSFLDTLGIALGGSVEEGPKILANFVKESGANPVSSVVGQGFKTSPQNAALANGMAADVIGFSDISVIYMNHPSVTICPAIWALGEQLGSSGKDMILAHILGVEIADKISAGVRPRFHQKGWHPLCVLGTFGAAAAAGKLLGFDSQKIANALGICGEQASGIKGTMGSMSKAYGAGRAAENGVVAASLTQKGFTGPKNIFETRDGFLQVFGEGADGSKILETLGAPFDFISPGITLKPYPSCTCTHTTISAVLKLRAEKSISPAEVESIECRVSPRVADVLKFHRPQNKFEAKYCIEYCVATALMDGRVVIPSFAEEKIKDPEKRKLMEKVKMVISPELAKFGYNPEQAPYGSTVVMKLKSGEEYTHQVNKGPWEPETPPSWDDVCVKYRGCAELVLKSSQIDDSIGIIHDLEKAQNICHLMDIVRG